MYDRESTIIISLFELFKADSAQILNIKVGFYLTIYWVPARCIYASVCRCNSISNHTATETEIWVMKAYHEKAAKRTVY